MKLGGILLLAFGLSMDAMAVAGARGLSVRQVRLKHVLLVSGFFGGFQALMPLFGWLLGSRVGHVVAAYNPWIIFVVLGGIGGKMLLGGVSLAGGAPVEEAGGFWVCA